MVRQLLIYYTLGYWKELILLSGPAYNDSITLYWNTIISSSLWFPPLKFRVQNLGTILGGFGSHLWPLALSGTLLLFLALCGTFWLSVARPGSLWQQSWTLSGSLWHSLAVFQKPQEKNLGKNLRKILWGPSWLSLAFCCNFLALCGTLIRSLALFGTSWHSLALWQQSLTLSGSLWQLFKNLRKNVVKTWGKFFRVHFWVSNPWIVGCNVKIVFLGYRTHEYSVWKFLTLWPFRVSFGISGTFDSLWLSFPLSSSLWLASDSPVWHLLQPPFKNLRKKPF